MNHKNFQQRNRNETENFDDPTVYFMKIGTSQGIETESPSPFVEDASSCSRQNGHLKSPVFTLSGDIQDEKSVISIQSLQFVDKADDRYSLPLQEPEAIGTSSTRDRYSSHLQEPETIDISTNGVLAALSFQFCETIDEVDKIDEKHNISFQTSELGSNLSSAIIARNDAEAQPTSSLQESELGNNLSSSIIAYDEADTLPPVSSIPFFDTFDDQVLSSFQETKSESTQHTSFNAAPLNPVSSISFFDTFDGHILSSFKEVTITHDPSLDRSKREVMVSEVDSSSIDSAKIPITSFQFFERFNDQHLSSFDDLRSTDFLSFRSIKRSKSIQRNDSKRTQCTKKMSQVTDEENYSSHSCLPSKIKNSEFESLKSSETFDEDLIRKCALDLLKTLNSLSGGTKTKEVQCENEKKSDVGDRLYSFSATKQAEGKQYRRQIADDIARANPSPPPLPKKKMSEKNKNSCSQLRTTRRISENSIEVILMAKGGHKNDAAIQAQDKNMCIEMDIATLRSSDSDHFRFERLHRLSERKQQLGKERRKRIEIERSKLNPFKLSQKNVQKGWIDCDLHLDGTAETCALSLDSS